MATQVLARVRRRAIILFVLGVAQMTGAIISFGLLLRDGPTQQVIAGVVATGILTGTSFSLRRLFWK